MTKNILGILVLVCLSQFSWAVPESLKTCHSKVDSKADFSVTETQVKISITGTDNAGKSYATQSEHEVVTAVDMKTADFTAEDLTALYAALEITGFTNARWINLISKGIPSSLVFFEYETGLYASLWLIGQRGFTLGKTANCK